jgi:hypothetical protein
MKKVSFLVLFSFVFQTCLFAANLHLCSDDGVSHICADRCPEEKPQPKKQEKGSADKDAKGSVHHDCGHIPAIVGVSLPSLWPAQGQMLKFLALPDPGIQTSSDIFHPPA